MKQQTFEFTYTVEDIINTEHGIELNKILPDQINTQNKKSTNYLLQSHARLFYGITEVGKIYYFDNKISQTFPVITNKYFENVVVELHPSPCFDFGTFVSGQLFYGIVSNVFDNDKKYSFKGLSTGGSFSDKNVDVSILTDGTPIRKVIINVKDLNCNCDN